MELETALNLLREYGFTKDNTPLLVLALVLFLYIDRVISPVKKSITRVTNAVIEIQTTLRNRMRGITLEHSLVEAPGSPLQPTELGRKYIIESGLEKILNEEKSMLKEKIELLLVGLEPTEYDVQEKAREVLISLKDDPLMNPVKEYAYQNGLDVDIILRAGGLWLRDDYLGKQRTISKTTEITQ